MKRIIQKDELGCGVACVAMLAGRTYAAVRREMLLDGEVNATSASTLRKHLKRLGCEVGARRLLKMPGHYSALRCDAILRVWPHVDGLHHWVVWDKRRELVLDPAETPYVNFKATHYLPVRQRGCR